MKPVLSVTAAAVAISLCIVGCRPSPTASSGVQHNIRIKLPWQVNPEYSFLIYGKNRGFKDANLTVALEPSKGSHEVAQAFDTKQVDFGFISSDSLVIARQRGLPVKALFVLYQHTPAVVISLKGSGIKEPKDLLSKKIGVIRSSTTFPQFLGMMKNAGCPVSQEPGQENVVLLDAVQGGAQQLQTKQFDALTTYIHFGPIQLQQAGIEIEAPIELSKYGIDIYSTVFAASETVISRDHALVQKVVDSMLDSIRGTIISPEVAVKEFIADVGTMAGSENFVRATISATNRLIAPSGDINEAGRMEPDRWNKTGETLVKTGQANALDPQYYYDDRFLSDYHARHPQTGP